MLRGVRASGAACGSDVVCFGLTEDTSCAAETLRVRRQAEARGRSILMLVRLRLLFANVRLLMNGFDNQMRTAPCKTSDPRILKPRQMVTVTRSA